MGGQAIFVRTVVSDPDAVASMLERTVEAFGTLEYALNNAGIRGERHEIHEYPLEGWNDVIDVNLNAVFDCLRREARHMAEQTGGGVIVNTASVVGESGLPLGASYAAAKHGVLGLTRSAALD